MPGTLATRVREVKRIAWRLAVSRACLLLAASVIGGILLAGGIDYVLRIADVGTRVLLTTLVVGIAAVGSWYWLRPIARINWTERTIASMIEKRFPELTDRLSSALAFEQLPEHELLSGSPAMKRNVIMDTVAAADQLRLQDAIDYGPWKHALGCFALATSLGALAFAASSDTSWQALRRLTRPWSDDPWPRQHHLRFVEQPLRIARGSDLRLEVQDRDGHLPPQVLVHLWYDGQGERDAEQVAMHRVGDSMVLQRNNLTRSFRYRATGGDDDRMEWRALQVVEPPQVISGTMRLIPPSYTGWPETSSDACSGGLRVIEGTRIDIQATADRELRDAELRFAGQTGDQVVIPALVREPSTKFEIPETPAEPWVATTSGEYFFFLRDSKETETVTGDRWSLRVLKDQPPVIRPIQPEAEEVATPEARVRLRFHVEDDLAVRRVQLVYHRSDQSDLGDQTITIWEGAETVRATTPTSLPPPTDAREVVYEWDLRPLLLVPGGIVSYRISAEDYKPQSAQSMDRRLLIVSSDELLDRVGRRQSQVLAELHKRLVQQQLARTQLDAVRTRLQDNPRIEKAMMDQLQAGMLAQGQVNAALHGDQAEIVVELQRLVDMLDESLIGDVDIRRKVEQTRQVIQALGTRHLEPSLRDGSHALRALQAARDQDDLDEVPAEVPTLLDQAAVHQQSTVTAIEELIDEMSVWDNYRRLAQEVQDVLQEQRSAAAAIQQLARDTVSRSKEELDANQRAELRGAAARQAELARRTDRSLRNLSRAASELEASDAASAAMVRDALDSARAGAVSAKMRQASQQINENRLGLAAQQQAEAEQTLKKMLEELSKTSVASARERARQLAEAERELRTLRRGQAELSREFEQARENPNPSDRKDELQRLVGRQEEITQAIAKLERRLRRLRATQAAREMAQARGSGQQAAQAARAGEAAAAQQQSRSTEAQMEAASASLQRSQVEATAEMAQEQRASLPRHIDALVSRQEAVAVEVERLRGLRAEAGELTDVQSMSVGMVAEDQRAVARETDVVAQALDQLPTFSFALDSARDTMDQAAEALEQRRLSPTTADLLHTAIQELLRVRAALAPEDDGSGADSPPETSSDASQAADPANSANLDARLAQLKMLREIQLSINEQTHGINEQTRPLDNGVRGDEQLRGTPAERIAQLAQRQSKLAELVSGLIGAGPVQVESSDAVQELPREAPALDGLDRELELLLQ